MKKQGFLVGVEHTQYNWDQALTESEDNPYPLAPQDLVEDGLVTPWSYFVENLLLSLFVYFIMVKQTIRGPLKIFGAGLLRDLHWVPWAIRNGCTVEIIDSSRVACVNTIRFLKIYNLHREVKIRHIEMETWLEGQGLGFGETLYAGQFFQNQGPGTLEEMMSLLGTLRTTVYMLHPRGEDNPSHLVRWNNTTPYEDWEWRTPYEKGLGDKAEVSVLGVHKYFGHQTYTLFRIRPTT